MYKKLIDLIRTSGHEIDDEINFGIQQLAELIEAKKANSDVGTLLNWLEEKRASYRVNSGEIGINQLKKWHVDPASGNVVHESGRFYSIVGVYVDGAIDREVTAWTQPMIKQDECGILGILSKKIKGIRHYLLQAKFEPGNHRVLQISPTLQATESNLSQVHKGKKPLLAEYFEDHSKVQTIVSVVSVEDGGRFYFKINKNVVIEVDENEEINVPDNFIWVNAYQLKKLMKTDLVANSFTREILGSL